MHEPLSGRNLKQSLKHNVEFTTGESVMDCYQCGKCTAGCPMAEEMDYSPNQVLRILQLEFKELDDKLLKSESIWLCLSCETCVSRCPKDVGLPHIMDYLSSESLKQNKVNPRAKDIVAFHQAFIESVHSNGKLHEVGLIAGYKMKTMHLMQDVALAPKMMAKGKLSLFPHKVKNKEAIDKMFKKVMGEDK